MIAYVTNPNQLGSDYLNLTIPEHFLCQLNLKTLSEENHLTQLISDEVSIHAMLLVARRDKDRYYNTPRAWAYPAFSTEVEQEPCLFHGAASYARKRSRSNGRQPE